MPDPSEPKRGVPWMVIPLVVTAYLLSVGPVGRISGSGVCGPAVLNAIGVFYWPVNWIAENCETCRCLLGWYIAWWIDP